MISFTCLKCRAEFHVDDSWANRTCKCSTCGAQLSVPPLLTNAAHFHAPPAMVPQSAPLPYQTPALAQTPQEDGAGKVCATLSIIFGCVAIIFCPIVFGLAGIVLGIIAVVRCKKKGLAITGLVISVLGTIIGVILGAAVALLAAA